MPICTPPSGKKLCTRGEYFTMSNGVFNFNFVALVFSEILGGSQIYTRGPYAPWTPASGEIFLPKASTSQYLAVHMQFTHYDLWLVTMLIMAVLSTCVHLIYQRRSTR